MQSNEEIIFKMGLGIMQKAIHENAKEHGWHDVPRSFGDIVALCHSELSEALEAHRNHDAESDKIPGIPGVEEELADCIIRILDYAESKGIDMAKVILLKHAYNVTRPYRHGGKAL